MVLASGTTLSWRPSSLLVSHSAGVKSARVSTLSASTCPRPRRTWSSSGGCGSLSNFILRNSLSSSFLDVRLICSRPNLERRRRRSGWGAVTTRAGMRLDPSGGGGNEGGIGRLIVNLCLAGGLTYLTVTDKLGWVFDTLVSLWLLAVLVPIISFVAFVWFAEREIVKGACPNCGQEFQLFEFAVKEQSNRCPYCSQPFKMDSGKQLVRDEPRFSSQQSNRFTDAFRGFGRDSSRKNGDPGGVIVDVEAEIVDRD